MRVEKILIRNFKSIEELNADLGGQSVFLIGGNGAGKSSFIQAVYFALTGEQLPPNPIKEGEKEGEISVTIKGENEESYTIEVKFTQKNPKGYLKVTGEDGKEVKSPRTMLNNLIGKIMFDPFEFAAWDGKKQIKFLTDLTGLDFTEINKQISQLEEDRKLANSKAKDAQGTLNTSGLTEEDLRVFAEPKDLEEIQKQISDAATINDNVQKGKNRLDDIQKELKEKREKVESVIKEHDAVDTDTEKACTQVLADAQVRIDDLLKQIQKIKDDADETVQKKRDDAAIKKDELKTSGAQLSSEITELEKREKAGVAWLEENKPVEVTELNEQFQKAVQFNKKAAEVKAYNEQQELMENQYQLAEEYTQQIKDLKAEKQERLEKANIGVPGLGIDEDGLTLDGLPLNSTQLPKSQIIETGVRIVMATNPVVKVVRITDGALLDQQTMNRVMQFVNAEGYQAFVEIVERSGGKLSVEIVEEGSIT